MRPSRARRPRSIASKICSSCYARGVVPDRRLRRLARRVHWVDRYRRTITLAIAACAVVFLFIALPRVLGSDWPVFHARLMAIVAGLVLAFAIEVGLAGVLAWWELQIDRLQRRESQVPRATLRRK